MCKYNDVKISVGRHKAVVNNVNPVKYAWAGSSLNFGSYTIFVNYIFPSFLPSRWPTRIYCVCKVYYFYYNQYYGITVFYI